MKDKLRAIRRMKSVLKGQATYIKDDTLNSDEYRKFHMDIIENFMNELNEMEEEINKDKGEER